MGEGAGVRVREAAPPQATAAPAHRAAATYRKAELQKGLLHHALCSFHVGHVDCGSLERKQRKYRKLIRKHEVGSQFLVA